MIRRLLTAIAFLLLASSAATAFGSTTHPPIVPTEEFPIPEGLVAPTNFWRDVYATYTTRQVVMHDNRYLHIVYGTLDYTHLTKTRLDDRQIDERISDAADAERERIIGILMELDSYKDGIPFSKLPPEARKIHDLFAEVEEIDKFRAAAERVRGQRGQRDKFLEGIARVAPYMPRFEQSFRKRGLPADLSRLTFVESMFNLRAYSKVGAAGPWQFMTGTGKRFLTINAEIDERMDPLIATDAAARLLEENYRHLGNWGLALTAYNHGVAGMKRAINEVGSDSIEQIVWAYESRSFGFASRNFYPEFLAARDVYNNRELYFGEDLKKHPPRPAPAYDEVVLPDHVGIETLVKHCGVTKEEVAELNPHLTRYVLSGQKYLPKSYPIKVPQGRSKTLVAAYAKIPRELRFAAQRPNEFHVVKRGDTLAAIARRYGMSMDALMDINSVGKRNRIRAGQKLRVLPASAAKTAMVAAKSNVKEPKVKVLPAVKLAADENLTVALAEEPLPIPELPTEEAELLAAAEAPAVEIAPSIEAPVSVASAVPAPAELPVHVEMPGKGRISLLAVMGVKPAAPVTIAMADDFALPAAATPMGMTATAAPALALSPTALLPTAIESLVPSRSPRRDRDAAREGRHTGTYPGGIQCRAILP